MDDDTLIGRCAHLAALAPPHPAGIDLAPIDAALTEELARLYLDSYPPGVAAKNLDDARAEVEATFVGDYGELWPGASVTASASDGPVGSVQVVQRSPWDPDLDCPFVIELFVSPPARGRGIGRSLLCRAATVCRDAGESEIALRIGDGTSAAALHLYRSLGMTPRR